MVVGRKCSVPRSSSGCSHSFRRLMTEMSCSASCTYCGQNVIDEQRWRWKVLPTERGYLFFIRPQNQKGFSILSVFARFNRYGISKLPMLYPVKISASTSLINSAHFLNRSVSLAKESTYRAKARQNPRHDLSEFVAYLCPNDRVACVQDEDISNRWFGCTLVRDYVGNLNDGILQVHEKALAGRKQR